MTIIHKKTKKLPQKAKKRRFTFSKQRRKFLTTFPLRRLCAAPAQIFAPNPIILPKMGKKHCSNRKQTLMFVNHEQRSEMGKTESQRYHSVVTFTYSSGSSNDSSTRAAGTRAVVSAQHEAMLTLMSVRRAGGPAHLSERGSSSLNAWAASEGASSMLKSSSPGHLPTLMRSCAGEDCRLSTGFQRSGRSCEVREARR